MRFSPQVQNVILALATMTVAGCSSVASQSPASASRAVIIYAAARESDARDVEARLAEIGFGVTSEREGPPVRERSSIAVYRVAREEAFLEPLEQALAGLEGVEWLPFVHGGPPNTDVVVWFVSHERDEAARLAEPAADDE